MLSNDNFSNAPEQLSIGNVISVSFSLYRYRFKTYLKLSLSACLWLLVPVYGWLRFLAISALISRLAFYELIDEPETTNQAFRYVRKKSFLALINLIFIYFASITVWGFSAFITFLFIGITIQIDYLSQPIADFFRQISLTNNVLLIFIAFISLLLFLLTIIFCIFIPPLWIYLRLFIASLPLAVEDNMNSCKTIQRSWSLTQKYFFRLLTILTIATLLISPLEIWFYLLGELIMFASNKVMPYLAFADAQLFLWLDDLLILLVSLVNLMILLPFIQSLKAVIYYNLRIYREAFDLQLSEF